MQQVALAWRHGKLHPMPESERMTAMAAKAAAQGARPVWWLWLVVALVLVMMLVLWWPQGEQVYRSANSAVAQAAAQRLLVEIGAASADAKTFFTYRDAYFAVPGLDAPSGVPMPGRVTIDPAYGPDAPVIPIRIEVQWVEHDRPYRISVVQTLQAAQRQHLAPEAGP